MMLPLLLICGILWYGLAAFVLPATLWGSNHLAFFPMPAAATAFVLAALLVAASTRQSLHIHLQTILQRWSLSLWQTRFAILLGLALLSWFAPVQHRLLGDGELLFRTIDSQAGLSDAHLLLRALYEVHGLLASVVGSSTSMSFRLVTGISGVFYLWSAHDIAVRLGTTAAQRLACFLLFGLSGTLVLFLGYVELYGPLSAILAIHAACLIRWDGRHAEALLLAALTAVLATALHPMGSYTIAPTFAAVIASGRGVAPTPRLGAAALCVGGAALVWLQVMSGQDDAIPLSGAYSFLSLPHLADLVRTMLLVNPLATGLMLGLLIRMGRWRSGRWERLTDPTFVVLSVSTVGALATMAAVDPQLGSLDWDLLSLSAISVTTLTAWLLCRQAPALATSVLFAQALLVLLHLAPWIAAQSPADRAVRVVSMMVEQDPHHTGDRHMKLGVRMLALGATQSAEKHLRRAAELQPQDHMAFLTLGRLYYAAYPESLHTALQFFQRTLELASADVDTRLPQAVLAWHGQQPAQAAQLCAAFLFQRPTRMDARSLAQTILQGELAPRDSLILQAAVHYADRSTPALQSTVAELLESFPGDPFVEALRVALPEHRTTETSND